MMDSVTRFAMAQREVGLAAGEPPTAKGYPPSVFALLPGLLERAGNGGTRQHHRALHGARRRRRHNEPIADAVRAILDGHIVLSRDLAGRNHYPAIDILQSVSRTMPTSPRPSTGCGSAQVREWLATIRDSEDLVSVGAYVPGANPRLDQALERREALGQLPVSARRHALSLCRRSRRAVDSDGRRSRMNAFRFRGARLLDWRRVQADAGARGIRARQLSRRGKPRTCWRVPKRRSARAAREYLATIAAPADDRRRSSGTGIGLNDSAGTKTRAAGSTRSAACVADQAARALADGESAASR